MRLGPLSLTLLSLCALACSAKPEAKQVSAGEVSPDAAPSPASAPAPDPKPRPSRVDPEHDDKLRDLDALCESVDHDYGDGTLGDYYHGLRLRTDWGETQREQGLESIKPGRLLEAAVNEVDSDHDDPALGHCHKLLGYLDDVE